MSDPAKFRFSIDRGGTFTDVYAEVPGEPGFRVVKLLSVDPANYDDAPREGIRRILRECGVEERADQMIDASRIEWIRMGTTVATNGLLERKGARCGLVITRGFGDLLRIGNQDRPNLFDLRIRRPELLYEAVIEVEERLRLVRDGESVPGQQVRGVSGEMFAVEAVPDLEVLRPRLLRLLERGITSLAVVFLHGYGYPDHEKMVGELARELGFERVSLSSKVMPRVRLVGRGDTTVVDSYLTPHIMEYLESFQQGFVDRLETTRLLFMQSDGGLVDAKRFTGSRAILSGPAGGVVGYAMTTRGERDGQPVIGFDMGGTSTDISRFGGEYELTFESETAGVRIQAPQLDIRTVAAGGGSRLFFENGMFKVGPESAGAHPGPVCYRKNGFLCVTDANLVLGRLQADYFPRIFGPEENQSLDRRAAYHHLAALTREINEAHGATGQAELTVEEVALGFLDVANEVMIRPMREVSVMRGYDIKEHVLAVFGGAGGQHGCALARRLGIKTLFIHRFGGILSAYGMGLADVVVERQRPAAKVWSEAGRGELFRTLADLQRRTEGELVEQGVDRAAIRSHRYLNLRYQGTESPLMVEEPEDGDFPTAFARIYQREFGFDLTDRKILVDDVRVRSVGRGAAVSRFPIAQVDGPPCARETVDCYFAGGYQRTKLYVLEDLSGGQVIEGPALLIQGSGTIVVEPGCRAEITPDGDVRITVGQDDLPRLSAGVDPVQLAIFSNLFMSIGEQMGRMLQKTALSTNMKERLDFSCALFDRKGDLVANAPHVPVHLGAMGEAIREQLCLDREIRPGDVLLSNHPATGGSHLPDITVMTPVFAGETILFWVASRGHHGDVGGLSPGSMPPGSRQLVEEGVAITSFTLVRDGVFREEAIQSLLLEPGRIKRRNGQAPISGARRVKDNLSDLKAQVAANKKGIDLVRGMIESYGLEVVQSYMGHVRKSAEEAVRKMLRRLSREAGLKEVDTVYGVEYLDDGSPIRLALTIDRGQGSALFDFAGTGPELWGNLNTPRAVTWSAILYCLRCLVDRDIPLNQGCLQPVTLKIPQGSLLDPSPEAAVVGGNVLTSQRLVDLIFKCFGAVAASQGCMNNLTFGHERFGYYETIGGGAGAGPGWHGQSGVHTHMTNTRITDPEVLERNYPVLVRCFSLRRGSGGTGEFAGGDGLIRELEFLESLDVAILSERRVFAPYGLKGGEAGKRGKNLLIRRDGHVLNLGGKNEIRVHAGDRIRILTPGGGGYGRGD